MTLMWVNDKEMSSIQQSIPFQEKNKPDSIFMKLTYESFLSSSEKKCSVSVESTLDLDCNDVDSNSFCDPKPHGVLWEDVLVLQRPSSNDILWELQIIIDLFQKRIEVEKNIEENNVIESTRTESRNSKVMFDYAITEENAQVKIVQELELLSKTPMYWKFQSSKCFFHYRLKKAKHCLGRCVGPERTEFLLLLRENKTIEIMNKIQRLMKYFITRFYFNEFL